MSSSKPMTATEIKADQKRRHIRRVEQFTVWAVSPTGDVTSSLCEPDPNGGELGLAQGHTLFRWYGDGPLLNPRYRAQGYTTLEEECRVSGQMELMQVHREIAVAQAKGMPVRVPNVKGTQNPDLSKLYPRTVLEKRALGADGAAHKGRAYVVGEGETVDPEVRAAVDEKLASLGLKAPEKTVDEKPDPKQGELAKIDKSTRRGGKSDGA